MELAVTLTIEAGKALLLLLASAAVILLLKESPARLRAVVLGTALVGSIALPLFSAVVPPVRVPVPIAVPDAAESDTAVVPTGTARTAVDRVFRLEAIDSPPIPSSETRLGPAPRDRAVIGAWLIGVLVVITRQLVSARRTIGVIRRAEPVTDPVVLNLLEAAKVRTGCRSRVRVVAGPEIGIPAVFGVIRPVILLPAHFTTWVEDRLGTVLRHELVHIARHDWPVRMASRIACAIYWFNPLAWWALSRLHLEQELACDEEVVSFGSRPSSYACHLLGIARVAVREPALAAAGLQMARRSDLEERIMKLLQRPDHRRVGFAIILPALLLTAALVPAIASVRPEPAERRASPALKAAVDEVRRIEEGLDPHLAVIEAAELDMEPVIAEIEALEAQIDHEALMKIDDEMAPIIERMRNVEIDLAPFHEQLEALRERLESMTLDIDDGTIEDVQRQIREQMQAHQAELESIHIEMAPFREQLERFHEQLAELTAEQTARIRQQMMVNHEILEQRRRELERQHEALEPLREEAEAVGMRIKTALATDVAAVLRFHLGVVASPDAPYREAAERIVERGSIHIHDDVLELNASRSEVREIVEDLFSPGRVATRNAFDQALDAAIDAVTELRLELE